jgi:ATP-dependent DNA helicase RecG
VSALDVRTITIDEALELIERDESHSWDHKSAKAGGAAIEKVGCCFANSEGGDFIVGVEDRKARCTGLDRWQGFATTEDGNFIEQALVKGSSPSIPYTVEWLEIDGERTRGLAALVTIYKSGDVHQTSKGDVPQRRGAQCLALTPKQATDLSLSKGAAQYEDQLLSGYVLRDLIGEPELAELLAYVPRISPAEFSIKQRLVDRDSERARVGAAVLFAESPPVVMPKKCAIKVARYETTEAVPRREHLQGTPLTVEGPARAMIEGAIAAVSEIVESLKIMENGTLVPARYPPEALKEVIVNAVIHRDYNVSDDILIRVFDNRVEVRSPGRLPGHVTRENIYDERFARNPTIVRQLNRYPDPPNKDIGEGLNTVREKMVEAKLSQPRIDVEEDAVVVTLPHTLLARPEEIVLEYLESHDEITNAIGRQICGIGSENVMKNVFIALNKAGTLERVPGKQGNKAAWQLTRTK